MHAGRETETQRLRREVFTLDPDSPETQCLREKSPEELFVLFDDDDSGLISFAEFRRMLPYLSIEISDAKALKYFRMCDSDKDDSIDVDEFRVALYICNPTSGNSVGYTPYKYLTPMDAFQTFDDQGVGLLDEDEFFFALDYLGIKLSDEKQENLFRKYDSDNTHSIDYEEFREAFLSVCDIKRELQDRGQLVPTFTRRKVLMDLLRPLLILEEEREKKALAGALRFKHWLSSVREIRRRIELAKFRAAEELANALDLGGQVYVFGSGTNNQFAGPPRANLKSKAFVFEKLSRVNELWRDRVYPEQSAEKLHAYARLQYKADKKAGVHVEQADEDPNSVSSAYNIDPYNAALSSPFRGLTVSCNTSVLWGRRITNASASESVIFALSDSGELFAWGGLDVWWHELHPDSKSKPQTQITPRSQLLLGTKDVTPTTTSIAAFIGNTDETMSPDELFFDMVMIVCKYYEVWEPPPNPALKMRFFDKELIPRVKYEDIQFSLKLRGKVLDDGTKLELMTALYEDILLERKLLGERAHNGLKELELQTVKLLARKKLKMADRFMREIDELWRPLREVQAENNAKARAQVLIKEQNESLRVEVDYIDWRKRVLIGRENMEPEFSPRGNSLDILINGATPRGPDLVTPRGFQTVAQIAAGASHTCLIHKSGAVYSWGVGAAGRLGLDVTECGDPQADVARPKLIQALVGRPAVKVSCGYSHSGVVTTSGELFMFGSATTGKCGLGRLSDTEECYCSIPTRVLLGKDGCKVTKISCGSAHTAAITEMGQMYVFGCGDGGRLGLGTGFFDTMYAPILVQTLIHEKISSVSCGNSTTIALTELRHEWIGETAETKVKEVTGGRVYVAGSGSVLGRQCDSFTHLQIDGTKNVVVKQASAGFSHSALVSVDGELYLWGRNDSGCCAAPPVEVFIPAPRLAACLYSAPENIALSKRAHQSTVYNCLDADIAVNGSTDGSSQSLCICTQMESQAWWEVDLGDYSRIDHIKLWNRCDSPRGNTQPIDLYTRRLFPCWVMIGNQPFSTLCTPHALKENLCKAAFKVKFTEDSRVSLWRCPSMARGRYVRVQLEGYNFLNMCELQVFGSMSCNSHGNSKVSQAVAGKSVTVAIVRPSKEAYDAELGYKRAAYADATNADILRQYETFASQYDEFGRGDLITSNECSVCVNSHKCETCYLFNTYASALKFMPTTIGGRRQNLDEVGQFLLVPKYPSIELPPLPRKERASRWREQRDQLLRALNPSNWIGYALQESDRELALQMKPHEMYEAVQEEFGMRKREEVDELDEKIAVRRRRMQAKKLRGKGVFVTSKELGARVRLEGDGTIGDKGLYVVRSGVPRSMERKVEQSVEQYLKDNNIEAVNMDSLIEDDERKRIEERFFRVREARSPSSPRQT